MAGRLRALARQRPPARTGVLLAATLVLSVGKGAFLATVVVYLLRIAELDTLAATTAMSLWGAASAVVAMPVGVLIDRGRGRVLGAVTAVGVAVLIPVIAGMREPWQLALALCVAGGLDSVGNVVRRALFASGAGDKVAALAWARTVTNVGFAIGGGLSVGLLASNSASAYRFAYLLIGAVYVLMAVCFLVTPLRSTSTAPTSTGKPKRDTRSGIALAVATSILTVHTTLLTTVLPLWVTGHTGVPVSTVGWLVMLNAVITVVGQIPVSSLAGTAQRALRCFRGSAIFTAACCALFGLVPLLPAEGQVYLLVAATVALTAGEMFEAAGEWGLSAALAADGEHGFFQSACVLGETTQNAVGPLLVGTLVTALPVLGWPLMIGAVGAGRHLAGRLPVPAEPTTTTLERS